MHATENLIRSQADFGQDKVYRRQDAVLEEISESKGVEAIADFCAAFVVGVAQGEITYEDMYGKPE